MEVLGEVELIGALRTSNRKQPRNIAFVLAAEAAWHGLGKGPILE